MTHFLNLGTDMLRSCFYRRLAFGYASGKSLTYLPRILKGQTFRVEGRNQHCDEWFWREAEPSNPSEWSSPQIQHLLLLLWMWKRVYLQFLVFLESPEINSLYYYSWWALTMKTNHECWWGVKAIRPSPISTRSIS